VAELLLELPSTDVTGLFQAIEWAAKCSEECFWNTMPFVPDRLDVNLHFNRFSYVAGRALYWHIYDPETWDEADFDLTQLEYYCACVELQQKSIFTFLLCWNQITGIKGPGTIVAKMVWETRADHPIEAYDTDRLVIQSEVEALPEEKRLKK
jgi:hypothetical protein